MSSISVTRTAAFPAADHMRMVLSYGRCVRADIRRLRLIALQFGGSTKTGLSTLTNESIPSHPFAAWLPSSRRRIPPCKWAESVRPPAALLYTRIPERKLELSGIKVSENTAVATRYDGIVSIIINSNQFNSDYSPSEKVKKWKSSNNRSMNKRQLSLTELTARSRLQWSASVKLSIN